MNEAISDILTKYPDLVKGMRSLSKDYEQMTLAGACNLPISHKEIMNQANIRRTGTRAFFRFFSDTVDLDLSEELNTRIITSLGVHFNTYIKMTGQFSKGPIGEDGEYIYASIYGVEESSIDNFVLFSDVE